MSFGGQLGLYAGKEFQGAEALYKAHSNFLPFILKKKKKQQKTCKVAQICCIF